MVSGGRTELSFVTREEAQIEFDKRMRSDGGGGSGGSGGGGGGSGGGGANSPLPPSWLMESFFSSFIASLPPKTPPPVLQPGSLDINDIDEDPEPPLPPPPATATATTPTGASALLPPLSPTSTLSVNSSTSRDDVVGSTGGGLSTGSLRAMCEEAEASLQRHDFER